MHFPQFLNIAYPWGTKAGEDELTGKIFQWIPVDPTGLKSNVLFLAGFLLDFVSYPVIKGFTSAAAITIGFNQVKVGHSPLIYPSTWRSSAYALVTKQSFIQLLLTFSYETNRDTYSL